MKVLAVLDWHSLTLEGAVAAGMFHVVHALVGTRYVCHGSDVLYLFCSSTVLAHETHSSGEDDLSALSRLDGPRGKRLSRSHPLYMVYDGYLCVAGKHKVAVHGMYSEVGVNRLLGCTQRLGDGGASEDAARTGWMP